MQIRLFVKMAEFANKPFNENTFTRGRFYFI